MALIDKADIEKRVGAAEAGRYSRNSDGSIDEAIAQAENRMRSEAIKVYTAESWDAMVADDLPLVAAIHLVSDAVDILSSGNNRTVGDQIEKKAEEARLFRIRLAKGEERCFETILTRNSSPAGGVKRISNRTEKTFDRPSCGNAFTYRDESI